MLQQFIKDNRESILNKWIDQTINTYEPEMVTFLKKETNQFSNPVRNTIFTSLKKVLDGILNDMNIEECHQGLEEIVKLRAVQSFSPSQALNFIFEFKKVIREELQKNNPEAVIYKELNVFEDKFDKLIGLSFDSYSKYREKIFEIRIKEIKAQSQRAFEIFGSRKDDINETPNNEVTK